ncbi:alpha/beta-hydrolase [Peniophora sp. CONT]|nr:alpha/beta-hydrolase [Peniophora sp. CONT]
MSDPTRHLDTELVESKETVVVQTRYGPVRGRRAANGAACFLEVPYALPAERWKDPRPLPEDYRYEDKEYIRESKYGYQPSKNGQAAGSAPRDGLGYGVPSEDPLFVNIVAPPSFSTRSETTTKYPVKVYIHGGFLQFGSPHGLSSQAQYVAAERNELWINVGYRLSAFGFLASDAPDVSGNFGFKDQWVALEWVRANAAAFGGDLDDIELNGLSAGAHSVHQLLHHASRLPEGVRAPFTSAALQSNAIATDPKTPSELHAQFEALCEALELDPAASDVLDSLRTTSWKRIADLIDAEKVGPLGTYGTFRGTSDGAWMGIDPGAMRWQRSGGFARGLKAAGVRAVLLGDLTEEWYLYGLAHEVSSVDEIQSNLARYYPASVVDTMMELYKGRIRNDLTKDELFRLLGDMLSEGQVHLPVRLLHRDLLAANFSVARYQIRWTPEQGRPLGYVTHATDRPLWAFRKPALNEDQVPVAREWLNTIATELARLQSGGAPRGEREILTLKEDRTIGWTEDARWEEYMRIRRALPGEDVE